MLKCVLVSCVSKKIQEPALAKYVYVSAWFSKAKIYAEEFGDSWFILSAKHGLLSPDELIAPYEQSLLQMRKAEREKWGREVCKQIEERIPHGSRITALAGRLYREQLQTSKYLIIAPMQGLGIGQQLQWLNTRIGEYK